MGFFSSAQRSPKPGSLATGLLGYFAQEDNIAAQNSRSRASMQVQEDNIAAQNLRFHEAQQAKADEKANALYLAYKKKVRLQNLAQSLLIIKDPSKQDIQKWALKNQVSPSEWTELKPIIENVQTKTQVKHKNFHGHLVEVDPDSGTIKDTGLPVADPGRYSIETLDGWKVKRDNLNDNIKSLGIKVKPSQVEHKVVHGRYIEIDPDTNKIKDTGIPADDPDRYKVEELNGWKVKRDTLNNDIISLGIKTKGDSGTDSKQDAQFRDLVFKAAKSIVPKDSDHPKRYAQSMQEMIPRLSRTAERLATEQKIDKREAIFPALDVVRYEDAWTSKVSKQIPQAATGFFGNKKGTIDLIHKLASLAPDSIKDGKDGISTLGVLGRALEKKGWQNKDIADILTKASTVVTLQEAGINPLSLQKTDLRDGEGIKVGKDLWVKDGDWLVNQKDGRRVEYAR